MSPDRSPGLPARLVWATGLSVAAALARQPIVLGALAALALFPWVMSRRTARLLGLAPALLAFTGFAVVLNLLAAQLRSPSPAGVEIGLWMAARLAVTALAWGWVAATVRPSQVIDELAGRLGGRFGRRSEDWAIVVLSALRFGPLLVEEGRRLSRSTALRVGRRAGPWMAPALAVPLVLAGVRRADRLAWVLEARHYGSGPRTPPVRSAWGWSDVAIVVAGIGIAAGVWSAR